MPRSRTTLYHRPEIFKIDDRLAEQLRTLAEAARVSKSHVIRVALGNLWRSFEEDGASVLELADSPVHVRRFMPPAARRRGAPARPREVAKTS